jgi:hypothetical protein
MKKRYRSWAALISTLTLSFLLAQGANAERAISYKDDNSDIIKYEDYKPLLFLEHGGLRSDIQFNVINFS